MPALTTNRGAPSQMRDDRINGRGFDFRLIAGLSGVAALAVAIILAGLLIKTPGASALPSFARQTGQPCSTCHTAFPAADPLWAPVQADGLYDGGRLNL